jgi:hypothetical protein
MSGFWAVFWLAVVLKIPIGALLYIVWWAAKDPPGAEVGDEGDGGSRRDGPHPRIRPPQPPRRGPHADPAPQPPARVRVAGRLPAPTDPPRRG